MMILASGKAFVRCFENLPFPANFWGLRNEQSETFHFDQVRLIHC